MSFNSPASIFPVLYSVISCHAWNGDRTQVAVCPGNSQIHVYETNGEQDVKKWKKIHELTDHDHLVTCIDWAPKTNRILSCSQDRNAYVWDLGENGKWNPSLVLLRINRAAVTCKWSPEENKFAVGSGAKTITVCYFESDQNWWVGKPTKKVRFRSTVLSLAWQPTNNQVLASASSDFKCRVIGAHLKNLEKEKIAPFSKTLQEYTAEGWVHDVAFSPSGKYLGFVSHNSTLTVVNMDTKEAVSVPYPSLPATRLLFLSDDNVVIAGHSYSPELFTRDGDNWVYKGRCDHGQYKAGGTGNRSSVRSAFMKFQKIDSVGTQNIGHAIQTRHENSINGLQVYKKDGDNVTEFTSCGIDGRLLFWEAKKCIDEAKL